MKRFIFVAALAVLVAPPAFAQVRLDQAITAFATSFDGVKSVDTSEATDIAKHSVKEIPQGNLLDGLDQMLADAPYIWELRDHVVVVKSQQTATVDNTRASSSQPNVLKYGTPVNEALDRAAECGGLSLIYEGVELNGKKLAQDVRTPNCQDITDIRRFLSEVLPGAYTADLDFTRGMATIRPVSAAASVRTNRAVATPIRATASGGDDSLVFLPNGSIMTQRNLDIQTQVMGQRAVTESIAEMIPRYRPVSRGAYPLPAGYYEPGYGSSQGYGEYYNYGLLYEHNMVQREIDRSTWGAIKFKKGRENFMQNVELWGCGQMIAQADEGNNFWDSKILVPTGCRPLMFRYSDGERDWEVEIDVMIVPLRMQSAKNITLDQNFFRRARSVKVRLQYGLQERPDGGFDKIAWPPPAKKK